MSPKVVVTKASIRLTCDRGKRGLEISSRYLLWDLKREVILNRFICVSGLHETYFSGHIQVGKAFRALNYCFTWDESIYSRMEYTGIKYPVRNSFYLQERPVRALCEAYMHHDQIRKKTKNT